MSWRQDAVEKASTQQSGPSGPRLSSCSWREGAGMRNMSKRGWALSRPGELERNTVMANRVGVNMLQFCSVSNSLSHTTLSIKWEVYFSKELCRLSLLCRRYDSACMQMYMHICMYSCSGYTTYIVKVKLATLVEGDPKAPFVIYWPLTEPSIKRCTCVNKRKNSGSRWALNNNLGTDGLCQLETRYRIESQW